MKFILTLFMVIAITLNVVAQSLSSGNFSSSDIVLKTIQGGEISGTLTVPNNVTSSPLVIIIAGSGPTDRDCNSAMGFTTNAYKMLAEGFAHNGISTLRYDKRGIGKSSSTAIAENDMRFETFSDDVVDWVSKMKGDNRFSKIILLGHSEGSLLGILAARKSTVQGFISIAGAGKSIDKTLTEQLTGKLPDNLFTESLAIIDSLKSGKTVSNVNPNLQTLFRSSIQPYMISWMKYDPYSEIKNLKIPVLIIQGSTDIQVKIEDARLLKEAKPDAKLLIIEKMNHVMKQSESEISINVATYNNPTLPLMDGLVADIVKFIGELK